MDVGDIADSRNGENILVQILKFETSNIFCFVAHGNYNRQITTDQGHLCLLMSAMLRNVCSVA